MLGNGADDIAFGEHPDRGIAFGPHDIFDHKRADITGAHQLGGNGNGFVHANRRNAGSFLAQDVSDLHRNLLEMSRRTSLSRSAWYTLCQMSIRKCVHVSLFESGKRGSNTDVLQPSP